VHVAVVRSLRRGESTGGPFAEFRGQWRRLAAFTVVGVVVLYTALPLAVDAGGISLAYVLLYTAPVWVTIGAVAFLGERVDAGQSVAMVATVCGVAALALSAGGTVRVSVASVSWGLVAGLAYSSYYLLGRQLFDEVEPAVVYAVALPVGGAVLAVAAGIEVPSASMVGWLTLLGLASTWLAWLLFALGVRRVPSSRAVVVAMVEPVLATLIGVAFYGERLGAVGFVGAGVVVVASAGVALRGDR